MIAPLPGDIFAPGQILNNTYEIEGVLGRGGTGEVYRARNTVTGQTVAIKALSKQFSGTDQAVELMRREAQMRDVRDDAVVRYSECSRSDQGHVFLVMDFIDGPSLADQMAQRAMDPRELMIVAHRVSQGLVAAHGHGIVHRDLSPDNVILRGGQAERATLIDFGIAKDTASGARTIVGNDFAGKYEYASPEQLEGRAEVRSDLYSLGATLLAAFRGRVPFEGALPGEMIRRKQSPLDTDGVPEPLKGLIDWLTQPKAADRPPSAEAVMARLAPLLAPKRGATTARGEAAREVRRGAAAAPVRKKRGGLVAVVLLAVLAAGGAAAWYSGAAQRLLFPLPTVKPYRIEVAASQDGGPASFGGNAPDAAAAAAIAAAAGAAGVPAAPEALTLALGVPSEAWPADAARGLSLMKGLSDWRFQLTDQAATVSGVASDRAGRDAAEAALQDWAGKAGLTLDASLAAGPLRLDPPAVEAVLKGASDCGPLRAEAPAAGFWSLGDTIRITGFAANPALAGTVEAALADVIGDRRAEADMTVLNDQICAVRAVLPTVPDGQTSVWFGDGKTGAANTSGIYHPGDNPVVEVLVPADVAGLHLSVFIVDNEDRFYSLIPNHMDAETQIDRLGRVENGARHVRVLHSVTLPYDDGHPKPFALQIDPDNFGKQAVLALFTKAPLFPVRNASQMSVEGAVAELTKAVAADPSNVVYMASRLMETRP
jgi:hypothetical protein